MTAEEARWETEERFGPLVPISASIFEADAIAFASDSVILLWFEGAIAYKIPDYLDQAIVIATEREINFA